MEVNFKACSILRLKIAVAKLLEALENLEEIVRVEEGEQKE